MRTKRDLTSRIRRDDRGAVLIIVAAFAVVAVLFLAVVIDLGDLRQEKKEVTLSTDAAALATAALVDTEDSDLTSALPLTAVDCVDISISPEAENPEGFANAQEVADDYLDRNGSSNPVSCLVVRSGFKQGYVLVSANEIVDYQLALAGSPSSGIVDGVSVAAIQSSPGGGLRPVGICNITSSLDTPEFSMVDMIAEAGGGNPAITLNGGAGYDVTFPLEKLKDSNQGCGNPNGNFGQLDLDGGSNPGSCQNQGGFCYQFENGYYGQVVNPIEGDPGNNYNNSTSAMDDLISTGAKFWVPVYGSAVDNGGQARFTATHYMEVQFLDYCIQNNCRLTHTDGDKYRYFEWRVLRFVAYSPAGPPQTADAATAPPRICSVTDDPTDIALNCLGPAAVIIPPPVTVTTTTTTTTTASSTTTTASTTTTTAGDCTVSPPPDNESQKVKNNTNELNNSVSFTIEVTNASFCPGISFELRRGNDVRSFSSVSGPGTDNTYTATMLRGSTPYAAGEVYTLVVRNGAGAEISATATLTITT